MSLTELIDEIVLNNTEFTKQDLISLQNPFAILGLSHNLQLTNKFLEKTVETKTLPKSLNKNKDCCPCNNKITKCNIKNDGSFKITLPGKYTLCHDVEFDPLDNDLSAITIDSDNVTLDLNCHKLSQKKNNTMTGIVGIRVEKGRNCVTITNGTVSNFSGIGVWYSGNHDTVKITDLLVKECGNPNFFFFSIYVGNKPTGGIAVGNAWGKLTQTESQNNILIQNCRILNNITCGLAIYLNNNAEILATQVDGTHNTLDVDTNQGCIGCLVEGSLPFSQAPSGNNLLIRDSTFNNTLFDGIFTVTVAGLNILRINGVTLTNVSMNNTKGDARKYSDPSFVSGLQSAALQNLLMENCHVSKVSGTNTEFVDGGHVSAFALGRVAKGDNYHIRDCSFTDIIGDNRVTCLLVAFNDNLVVDSNQFAGAHSIGSSAIGCVLAGGFRSLVLGQDEIGKFQNAVVKNSTVQDITNSTGSSFGILFSSLNFEKPTTVNNNIVFDNCVASSITANTNATCFAIAQNPDNTDPGKIENGEIRNCVALQATGATSSGYVVNSLKRGIICGSSATNTETGFLLENGAIDVLVENNKAVNNSSFGFRDAVGSGNAFVKNTAFNNSTNYSLGTSANVDNVSV